MDDLIPGGGGGGSWRNWFISIAGSVTGGVLIEIGKLLW